MKLFNTVFVNADIQHDCGHVLPATIELQGDTAEAKLKEKRVTINVFFIERNAIRFFAEGMRENRLKECPKCHKALPTKLVEGA